MEYINTNGIKFTILEKVNAQICTVQFEDGVVLEKVQFENIKKGIVKNPYTPSVYNIGFMGSGKYRAGDGSGEHTDSYRRWLRILQRCHSTIYQAAQPTYIGCSVAPEWHNFQNFAEWHEENCKSYMQGWQLYKDILVKGNRVYSPETCCFVPQEINSMFTKNNKVRGAYPIGVSKRGSKFRARMSISIPISITLNIGTFNTMEEAFDSYKRTKEQHIKIIADKYKTQITETVYQALYNYKVEITD